MVDVKFNKSPIKLSISDVPVGRFFKIEDGISNTWFLFLKTSHDLYFSFTVSEMRSTVASRSDKCCILVDSNNISITVN